MVKNHIPNGITAEHVLAAIGDFASGVAHDFGPSTTYDLVVDGVRYPPKAILGLAAMRATGKLLKPRDFTGGEVSRCFSILRSLGFTVVPKLGKGAIWSRDEYKASVDAYLAMLVDELAGRPSSKRAVRLALLNKLNGRTAASSEKRMQNISAALVERKLPFILGYKPLANYADDLDAVLDEALAGNPVLALSGKPKDELSGVHVPVVDLASVPLPSIANYDDHLSLPWRKFVAWAKEQQVELSHRSRALSPDEYEKLRKHPQLA